MKCFGGDWDVLLKHWGTGGHRAHPPVAGQARVWALALPLALALAPGHRGTNGRMHAAAPASESAPEHSRHRPGPLQ